MHTRRLVKRSILGSRVYAPSPTGDGAPVTGVVQAVKQENSDVSSTTSTTAPRRNVYTVLLQDGSLKEFSEEEIASGANNQTPARGPLKPSLKQNSNNGFGEGPKGEAPEEQRLAEGKRPGRPLDPDARSVSLLEQKRKVVSSSIDVPHARRSEEEVDMDKVTAAMVLTSLSTSPLVRSPPVKVGEALVGSWKDPGSAGPLAPSSYSSSGGYWSWSAPSDQSNPSTPSPPLSADSCKPFRVPSLGNGGGGAPGPEDPSLDDQDGSSLLFDEPIPRKRKNSMKVMFKCLWKNCGKVLSTAAGIQRHIRTVHLGRNCDSDWSDGEEDFYYTEIKLNTDEGLGGPSPATPSVLSPPLPPHPHPPPLSHLPPAAGPAQPGGGGGDAHRSPAQNSIGISVAKDNHGGVCNGRLGGGGGGGATPLSRSAPSALYLIHADHAYQATAPVSIPSADSGGGGPAVGSFTPTNSFSISWQSPPVTFTGNSVSPCKSQSFSEQRPQTIAVLSSPPRATTAISRKVRGEGKKCRKVYGMENRDMWCTACRWKKACQRFTD
ncbi:zinc finger protein 704 isoform X1 [Gadus morhua]|uniref:Zinc finger protein 704 n=1 Tax=Gadus morhua TaxID=8049 RepID=A0A8C5D4Y7_GADMO|nr:zinc finger protein 704 isoform X1 [Gadus morhua]XP_030202761.1 zinc finger protein 704 isoform X1 [Gadus morhua]